VRATTRPHRINPRWSGRAGYATGVPPTIAEVGLPPAPLPPEIRIVDSQGKPTTEYFQWQMQVHDWRMMLYAHLGGSAKETETP
jgi:hypothetical protein